VTAKYANDAKKEVTWGFPSRIWRISRLSLFASCRRPLSNLCAPVVKIRAKQSQFTGRRRAQLYKQTQFAQRCCGPLYKQTQSGVARVVSAGQFCGTKPIPPAAGGTEGEMCETKPNLGTLGYQGGGRAEPWLEPIVQNKPNLQRFTTEAQRSQRRFWTPSETCSRFHSPWPPCFRGEYSCETKPMSGYAGRAEAWGRATGVLYKQTQFLRPCRSGDRRSREGRLCETNPISGSLRFEV
jgi:hypothetical protein